MRDSKLIFDDSAAITTARVTSDLKLADITEAGRGSQLFINVYLTTAFSSDTDVFQIDLITSSGVPTAGNALMTILPATAVSGLQTPGLIAKMPLPSVGLEAYVGLSLVIPVELATGTISAFLSLI
jgi:hypothetical protein